MKKFHFRLITYFCFLLTYLLTACDDDVENNTESNEKNLIETVSIYSSASEYCAFCDIIYFNDRYYIAFRVGNNHVPYTASDSNGYIKIMSSSDKKNWEEEICIVDEQWDLRDPNFCLNTDTNELSMNIGLYNYANRTPEIKNKRIIFSCNDKKLEVKEILLLNVGEYSHYWIWKIYYYDNRYYGVGYYMKEYPVLVCSEDGIHYEVISKIPVDGNETALAFYDDRILAFSRNIDDNSTTSFVSISKSPYTQWTTHILNEMLASPETVFSDLENLYVAGRTRYGVSIFQFNLLTYNLDYFLNLFAIADYGNRGYPGMIIHNGYLDIVYYACNEYKVNPSIYLTSIRLN